MLLNKNFHLCHLESQIILFLTFYITEIKDKKLIVGVGRGLNYMTKENYEHYPELFFLILQCFTWIITARCWLLRRSWVQRCTWYFWPKMNKKYFFSNFKQIFVHNSTKFCTDFIVRLWLPIVKKFSFL